MKKLSDPAGQNPGFVSLNFGNQAIVNRDTHFSAEHCPHCAKREGFHLFEEENSLRIVGVLLQEAQILDGLQEGQQQGFLGAARPGYQAATRLMLASK
jgi:hypothetical protein